MTNENRILRRKPVPVPFQQLQDSQGVFPVSSADLRSDSSAYNRLSHDTAFKYQIYVYTELFKNDCRGVNKLVINNTRLSPDATPCDFLLWGYVKDQVYVPPLPASIPELKVVKCYKQFGTNSIIVLMFVESQRVHI